MPPGESAGQPLFVREAPEQRPLHDALDLVLKITTFTYTVIVAWQTLKIVCPPLQIQEDIAIAHLRKWITKPKARSVHVPHAWIRELYDETR